MEKIWGMQQLVPRNRLKNLILLSFLILCMSPTAFLISASYQQEDFPIPKSPILYKTSFSGINFISTSKEIGPTELNDFFKLYKSIPKGTEEKLIKSVWFTNEPHPTDSSINGITYIETKQGKKEATILLYQVNHKLNNRWYRIFAHEYGHVFSYVHLQNDSKWKKYLEHSQYLSSKKYLYYPHEVIADQYSMLYWSHLLPKETFSPYFVFSSYESIKRQSLFPFFDNVMLKFMEQKSKTKSTIPKETPAVWETVKISEHGNIFGQFTSPFANGNHLVKFGQLTSNGNWILQDTKSHKLTGNKYYFNAKQIHPEFGTPFFIQIVSYSPVTKSISDTPFTWYEYNGSILKKVSPPKINKLPRF